jgi:hypothetical protein
LKNIPIALRMDNAVVIPGLTPLLSGMILISLFFLTLSFYFILLLSLPQRK